MTVNENITDFLNAMKDSLLSGDKEIKRKKLRLILRQCGYSRRSQNLVDEFNNYANEIGIELDPKLDMFLDFDDLVAFSLANKSTKKDPVIKTKTPSQKELHIEAGKDFFYYLFKFDSDEEYEIFQACLNSNRKTGIFLIPKTDDFFSEIVEKVLTYQLIRKRQYIGELDKSSKFLLSAALDKDKDQEVINGQSIRENWMESTIFSCKC